MSLLLGWFLTSPLFLALTEPVVLLESNAPLDGVVLGEGALAPEVVPDPSDPDQRVLRLPYRIEEGDRRAYWDFPVDLNLGRFGRFEMESIPTNPEGLTYLTVYFGSPPGWMGQSLPALAPRPGEDWRVQQWGRVTMDPENPGPWTRVTTIRVSAWADAPTEGALLLRRIVGYSDPVALVLPVHMRQREHSELTSAESLTERVAGHLTSLGVPTREVADTEIAQGALEGARVAIFAYVPEVDPHAREALEQWIRDGGRAIVFYSSPDWLLELVGIREVEYLRPAEGEEGRFETVVLETEALPGAPASLVQQSWNVREPRDLREDAKVLGRWRSRSGEDTGPALVVSDTGAYMAHVLTNPDREAKAALLLALVGHFEPTAWEESYAAARSKVGQVGPHRDEMSLARTVQETGRPAALEALDAGLDRVSRAEESAVEGNYVQACSDLSAARQLFIEAYARSVPSRPGEWRGVWCHSAFGAGGGWDWEQSIATLAESGFTAVVPNMLWAGMAFYPSAVLPEYPELSERGDQVAQCLEAARRHGLEVHVWKVNFYLGRTTEEWMEAARREGRLQMDPEGREIDWLCPSSDRNFEIERDSMLELVRNYDIDGIHFDYIRYPDLRGCYCPRCREKFEAELGHPVENWPADVWGRGAPLQKEYLDFRRAQINRLVEAVSTEAHALRPDIQVSAAVWGYWKSSRDTIGQDWVHWIDEGWLDFVCPMDYLPDNEQYAALVRDQAEWVAGRIPMYPGMGAYRLTPDQLVYQIELTRQYAPGFMVFDYNQSLVQEYLPLLRMGATAPESDD